MSRQIIVLFLVLALLIPVPAAMADEASPIASPTAGITSETLVTTTLPAATVPAGEAVLSFLRITWDPGASQVLPSAAPSRSVALETVLSGTYAVRVDGPLQVLHRDGTTEDVPNGTEVTLGAGETVIYLDNAAPQVLKNAGSSSLVTLGFGIFSTVAPATPFPDTLPPGMRFEELGFLDPINWARAGLTGPLSVVIRRVTLDPGATLPLSEEAWPILRSVETGTLSWQVVFPGQAITPLAGLTFMAGRAVPWTPLAPGRALLLTNAGNEDVTVLELLLAPAPDHGTPTA